MHWKITALWGGKKVELRETQRSVTPFGGLVVFFEFLQRIGYCEAVRQHLPFTLRSPNAIDPVKTFTAFLLSVVAGSRWAQQLVAGGQKALKKAGSIPKAGRTLFDHFIGSSHFFLTNLARLVQVFASMSTIGMEKVTCTAAQIAKALETFARRDEWLAHLQGRLAIVEEWRVRFRPT